MANPPSDEQDMLPDVPVQWRRMIGYLKPYRTQLAVALLAVLLSSGLSLVFPAVIQSVVDVVFEQGDISLLNSVTGLLVLVFLARAVTSFFQYYNITLIGERVVVDIRKEVYAHLHKLSLSFYTERRVGELVSRVFSDVNTMRTVLTNNIVTLLQQSLVMVGAIIIMVVLNWRLTVFILISAPLLIVIAFSIGRITRRISTIVTDEIALATTAAEESFQNIREVKSFVREDYEVGRYDKAIDRAFNESRTLIRVQALFNATMAFLGFGTLAAFLWFGGREVLEGRLSAGELVAFLIYGSTVAGSLASLAGLYTQFQSALGSTKRVFQLMDTPPHVSDNANARDLGDIQGRITFDDVQFTYDGKQTVLNDINLDIAPGEIVALVGPSGAGKSTMFNLIPRFYDPVAGRICVDGVDLREVTQHSLRSQVGIVPQETLLFGGTIRENILYGDLKASDDEIIAAARAANAHDFIMNFPDQYETIVGERGIKLSGGQRQRIAIARAILKDPRILLLDEATSSLDNESEHLVQEAFQRLMQNRTTVIIAHRLSTVRIAHRIAVLDKGHLVELGSHDDLMAQHGLYARLYDMQFREDEPVLTAGD